MKCAAQDLPSHSAARVQTGLRSSPRWQKIVLACAMLHSGIWGLLIILLPQVAARVYGFHRTPVELHLWQGTGLFILLLATGYGIALRNPRRHWAVVLIGLLAKILGAAGMCFAVYQGQVSTRVLWLLPLNDVIWWFPFALIVRDGICDERQADAAA